jgi:hypothetical protein
MLMASPGRKSRDHALRGHNIAIPRHWSPTAFEDDGAADKLG